jgi:hypothetical protein
VAIGGGDWHIGEGDFHRTLQGIVIVCVHINKNEVIQGKKILRNIVVMVIFSIVDDSSL